MTGFELPPEYPRVWGVQVGKVRNQKVKVTGGLDVNDNNIAITTTMMDLEEAFSDSDTESDNGEEFAAENGLRPTPTTRGDTVQRGGSVQLHGAG